VKQIQLIPLLFCYAALWLWLICCAGVKPVVVLVTPPLAKPQFDLLKSPGEYAAENEK
jgi:hypothetical protein